MALPTNFTNLEWNYFGAPIIVGASKTSIDFSNLEYGYFGEPLVVENFSSGAATDLLFILLL
jgi:hypothetical protein